MKKKVIETGGYCDDKPPIIQLHLRRHVSETYRTKRTQTLRRVPARDAVRTSYPCFDRRLEAPVQPANRISDSGGLHLKLLVDKAPVQLGTGIT
jgi:hypothetical protein